MTDVEQLLRDTLTDPRRRLDAVPDLYEGARGRARRRRRHTIEFASAAVVVTLVATTAGVVARGPGHRGSKPASKPVASVTPPALASHDSTSVQIDLGPDNFSTLGVVSTRVGTYVLVDGTPARVLKLDVTKHLPKSDHVTAAADGPAGGSGGITLDANGVDLFVWTNSGALKQYEASTLAVVHSVANALPPGVQIFDAVSLSGQPWFATNEGLFVVSFDNGVEVYQQLPGIYGVYGIAADPVRHRIIVGTTSAAGVAGIDAVDVPTHVVSHGAPVSFVKESIAVVGDQIWVGGYGDMDKPRLLKLAADTLQPLIATLALNGQVGPGAVVWAGESVLWVRHGGDTRVDCVDAQTGDVIQTWSNIQGPVSSVAGAAFAVNDGGLKQLTLDPACKG
jgi:hypothetical protein